MPYTAIPNCTNHFSLVNTLGESELDSACSIERFQLFGAESSRSKLAAIQQIGLCACHGQANVKQTGGPAGAARRQNDFENCASRNSPNLAVALNCGMGSSSLNAEVNAFERLQIVRGRNSSYFGSK